MLDICERIEACGTKRNPKLEILKENSESKDLYNLFRQTYHWLTTYGIIVAPYKGPADGKFVQERWLDFRRLLRSLAKRELSGNAAREAWTAFISRCSGLERKWYTRVINRDLKIGVSVKTLKKVWSDMLPVFGVMLAEPHEKKNKPPVELDLPSKKEPWRTFPIYMEPKLDGMRVTVVIRDEEATAHSRDGHEFPGLQFIADECMAFTDGDCVVDGEVHSENWNKTITLAKTQDLPQQERDALIFHIFDLVDLGGFMKGLDPTPLQQRGRRLKELLKAYKQAGHACHLRYISHKVVTRKDQIATIYANHLAQGFEGSMLKYPSSPYLEDRHYCWIKMKPVQTFDGVIVGHYEGTAGTKNEGSLGGFVVKMDGKEKTINVGGGFTDAQRTAFWEEAKGMVGMWLEFKGQGNDSVTATARFGRFVRLRPDKA